MKGQSLDSFVVALSDVIGCDRWELRESSNYAEDRYFRCSVLGVEIAASIADSSEFTEYDFSLWFEPIASYSAEKAFIDGLADCTARQLALNGYVTLRPHSDRKGSGGTTYRPSTAQDVSLRERIFIEEI